MNRFITISLISLVGSASVTVEASRPRQEGKVVLPKAATEGPRQLKSLQNNLADGIKSQPFGKKWKEIVVRGRSPKSGAGLGKADTHPNLKFDPIELQEQSQYVSDTSFAERFGWLSIRLRRVFRYGRLLAVQIVIEPIGELNQNQAARNKDIELIKKAWAKPLESLGLKTKFHLVFNDLTGKRVNKSWIIQIERGGAS
jgi:hypothetical protein